VLASKQLYLFEGMVDLPWDGRSPRSLTRSAKALFLRREPQKASDTVDGEQLLIWPVSAKRAPRLRGAPLLLEASEGR